MMHKIYDVSTLSKLDFCAKDLSPYFSNGDIVLIYGDLGSGKTTFVKFIVHHLNGNISQVISPTFNIICHYQLPLFMINHLDLYRLKDKSELEELALDDILGYGITFIEWPELIVENLQEYHTIKIYDFKLDYYSKFNYNTKI